MSWFYSPILLLSPVLVFCVLDCLDHVSLTRYFKIKSCRRSSQRIIGAANFDNLSECEDYARRRKALAFNFSPLSNKFTGREIGYASSCQLLGCPEIGNASSLVKDPNYDYYSIYSNMSATQNTTCIRSVGLFLLNKEKKNYTEAISFCQLWGGDLANILSESRTNMLSNVIQSEIQEWYKAAYVGLDDMKVEGLFRTPLGSPLNCFKYRAWAPSHPRNKSRRDDCVILDHEKSWKVVNCKHKLPFICELYPDKVILDDEFSTKPNCSGTYDNAKKSNQCLNKLKMYELLQNSSRVDICTLLNSDEDALQGDV